MVKKSNGKWRMCTDYTNLHKACLNDAYPWPSIDRLVDGATGHHILSFLDIYSVYNKIRRHPRNKEKNVLMTDYDNFYYEVLPFGLKNAGATFKRLMDQISRECSIKMSKFMLTNLS